jgi:IS5 family transposase
MSKRSQNMKQISFAEAEFGLKKKVTRREKFLAEMEQVVPWSRLLAVVEPCYPTGDVGRPRLGLEKMLRLYFVQQWYGLADEATEDAVYDSHALRKFLSIDLARERVPDATSLLGFRHLLERNGLTRRLLDEVNAHLAERGVLMREGTIVDATIIAAPPSTKNKEQARDPAMHQTKKGNEWHFGMKAHIGVDATSGLVHTVIGTAANVADVTVTGQLLHGEEKTVHADAGYTGAEKREELRDLSVHWQIAAKRGKIKVLPEGEVKTLALHVEFLKAQVRARVEHPFHVVKNLFRHRKVRYRGMLKNTAQLLTLFALANLVIAKRHLLPAHAQSGS